MKIDLPEDVRLTMQSILDGTAEDPVDGIAYLADELVVLAQNLGGRYTPREALVAHLQGYRQRIENALVSNRQRRDGDKIAGSAWLRIDGDELELLDDLILGRPPTYWLHYAWGDMTDEAKSGAVADAVELLLTAGFTPHHSLASLTSPSAYYNTTMGQIRVYRDEGRGSAIGEIYDAMTGRESQTDGQDQPEADDDAEAESGPWTDGIAADIRLDLPARLDTPATRAVDAAVERAQRRTIGESDGFVRDIITRNFGGPVVPDPGRITIRSIDDTPAAPEVPPPPPATDGGDA